jgi:hypothetical protein
MVSGGKAWVLLVVVAGCGPGPTPPKECDASCDGGVLQDASEDAYDAYDTTEQRIDATTEQRIDAAK